MLISYSKKFIFVHNYKVAGTSIGSALSNYNNRSFCESSMTDQLKILLGLYPGIYSCQFYDHINAVNLKRKLPKYIFDKYYKFGFVRNPWAWQVSQYNYMLKLETHKQHKLIKSMRNFDEYIEWRVSPNLNSANLYYQKDFFYDKNVCLVDFIGRMENLRTDFDKICKRIGIIASLPHLNRSRDDDNFLEFYTQKSIDMVFEIFKEDIQLFGYSKPEL